MREESSLFFVREEMSLGVDRIWDVWADLGKSMVQFIEHVWIESVQYRVIRDLNFELLWFKI